MPSSTTTSTIVSISTRRARTIVLALRLTALVVTIVVVPALWRVMLWLPWQVDCLIAAASSLAFAYRFEREEGR